MNRHYFLKLLNGKQIGFKIFNTLVIWKMYIKTTVIDHLAPGRMAVMKKIKHFGKDVESGEFLHYVGIKS